MNRVAGTDVTVLIRGESGTGKELIARRIHEKSTRRGKPLIKVHCPAIPETLLESELFGYEKGSFTGAHRRRPGRFEFADGGTIFLDEIGDIPLELQAKLLQVLQEGEFARLGGTTDVRVNVRIIAATNKDLDKAIQGGTFREDLFYRLNVVNIYMLPLRDRKGDIPSLIQYFLDRFNRQFNKRVGLSEDSVKLLLKYHWPGNVREMENTVKEMVILGNERQVADQLRSKIDKYRSLRNGSAPGGNPASPTADHRSSPPQERRGGERRRRLPTGSLSAVNGSDSTSLKTISRDAAQKAEQALIQRAL
ncbi:MAG: sigma-54 interaction domain-containing protein, partial [Nitrospiria bacterium]